MLKLLVVSCILSLSSLVFAQGPFSSKDVKVLMRSEVVKGSVKISSAEDSTQFWRCISSCYQVTIEFRVQQPQTNYQFAGLASVGHPDSSGRTFNYEAMTAQLNLGALTSMYEETVKVVLPEAILPLIPEMASITLNGQKYNFFLNKQTGSLEIQ